MATVNISGSTDAEQQELPPLEDGEVQSAMLKYAQRVHKLVPHCTNEQDRERLAELVTELRGRAKEFGSEQDDWNKPGLKRSLSSTLYSIELLMKITEFRVIEEKPASAKATAGKLAVKTEAATKDAAA